MVFPHMHAIMRRAANGTSKPHLSGTIVRPKSCLQNFFDCFHDSFRTGISGYQ